MSYEGELRGLGKDWFHKKQSDAEIVRNLKTAEQIGDYVRPHIPYIVNTLREARQEVANEARNIDRLLMANSLIDLLVERESHRRAYQRLAPEHRLANSMLHDGQEIPQGTGEWDRKIADFLGKYLVFMGKS